MKRKNINIEYWKARYELDPEGPTGLKWKSVTEGQYRQWGNKAGTPAGRIHPSKGYYRVRSGDEGDVFVHRLVWALYYNEQPPEIIDHINRDKTDNRIENLRACTNLENTQNWKGRGYCLDKRSGKYQAEIKVDGIRKWLGYFDNEAAAANAYMQAKLELHPSFTP